MKKDYLSIKEQYDRSNAVRLEDVYKKYSYEKKIAFEWCLQKAYYMKAIANIKIISFNTFMFSVAFPIENGFVKITPYHTYVVLNN